MRLKVVFMGTPEFAVSALEAVHSAHEIVAVYTQPDRPVGRGLDLRPSPVKREALKFGLPVFQPERLSLPGEFEKLTALGPDIIVVVAYGQILKKNVLDLPRLGCVNIHSSLLPRWRGAAPIQWAILSGDRQSGVTTMKLVERLDAGDILLQATTPISKQDTAGTLHDRLSSLGASLILPTLRGLEDGSLVPVIQEESKVTYATKLTKEMECLDTALPSGELDLRVRALNPWPGTSIWVQTTEPARIKVKKALPRPDRGFASHSGQLFEYAGMLLLGCKDGALEIQTLQWDGKKEVDAASFLNGLKGQGRNLPLPVIPYVKVLGHEK